MSTAACDQRNRATRGPIAARARQSTVLAAALVLAAGLSSHGQSLPAVTNTGATEIDRATALLRATVTDTGGETPSIRFLYWLDGDGTTNSLDAGTQSGACSSRAAGLLPSSNYSYRVMASNSAGAVFSGTRGFTALSGTIRYVWTNGNDTADGTNWATAWATLSNATVRAPEGAVILVSNGTYTVSAQVRLTNGITVRGFAGAAGTIVRWPGNGQVVNLAHSNAVLDGVAIRDSARGVLVDAGLMTNCWILHNSTGGGWGGGIAQSGGLVANCVISSNALTSADGAWTCGGGSYMIGGAMINCRITHNLSAGAGFGNGNGGQGGGGGVALRAGLMRNCLVANNTATLPTSGHGGGVTFVDGVMENCTIASNTCASGCYGGGVNRVGGMATNCIVFGNKSGSEDYDVYGTNGFRYSCAREFTENTGTTHNTAADPVFVSVAGADYHLAAGSPCRDTATNLPLVTMDLDGGGRPVDGDGDTVARPDMGCYEAPDLGSGPLSCSFSTEGPTVGFLSLEVVMSAFVAGGNTNITWFGWDFNGDGTNELSGADRWTVTNTFSNGSYSVHLTASNAVEGASHEKADWIRVYPSIYYVSLSGSQTAPYDTWDKAATNIQVVHDFATAPGTTTVLIRVATGTYARSTLNVTKALTIRSEEGPTNTVLKSPSGFVVYMNHAQAVLDGFSLRDSSHGAQIYNGVLTNCWVLNNVAASGWGGGIAQFGGTVARCVISSNALTSADGAWTCGGGSYMIGGAMVNCRITHNLSAGAGFGNGSGGQGGGGGVALRDGLLRNCLVANNTATLPTTGHGGGVTFVAGVMENCTIASNTCASGCNGGGVNRIGGMATNCIVFANKAGTEAYDVYGTNGFRYSCAPELTENTGTTHNIFADPLFVDLATADFHLSSGSPCIDTGIPTPAVPRDLDGLPRPIDGNDDTTPVMDMGCYEAPDATTGVLRCNFSAPEANGLVSLEAVFTATVAGQDRTITWFGWDFDNDGDYEQAGAGLWTVTNTYGNGSYSVLLVMSNLTGEGASKLRGDYVQVYPDVYYVSLAGSNLVPYDAWSKAATNLQTVHDYASAPGTTTVLIRVATGTYVRSTLNITKALTIRSEEGAANTALKSPSGFVVYMNHAQAVLDGFSLRDSSHGAQIYNGVLTNCWVLNNVAASGWGGGIAQFGGTVARCVVSSNALTTADGAWTCGGGSYMIGGAMINCRITHNLCAGAGFGNGNGGQGGGGGVALRAGLMRNCLVANNTATLPTNGHGGGVVFVSGVMENCTVASNTCAVGANGGGVSLAGGMATNCLVFGNKRVDENNNVYGTNGFRYSCAPELTTDTNTTHNTSASPVFREIATGDYRLRDGSPGVNMAIELPWMEAGVDLVGTPRIMDHTPDMGAYETIPMKGIVVTLF